MRTIFTNGQIAIALDEETRMLTIIHDGLVLTQVNGGGLTVKKTQDSSGYGEILIKGGDIPGSEGFSPTIFINRGDLRWNEVNLVPK
jgi:hypothetical protein